MKRFSFYKLFNVIIYSYFCKRKFHSCGKNFRIYFPALLNNPKKMAFGDDVSIASHAWFNCLKNSKNEITLKVGNGVSIGRFAHINAYEKVIIEDYVLIAERVHISDCSHIFSDPEIPIIHQGEAFQGEVIIQRGAWIGSGAVILPGTNIGRNAVVGANAVVTRDVPDNYIARGVPAKMFPKKRKK